MICIDRWSEYSAGQGRVVGLKKSELEYIEPEWALCGIYSVIVGLSKTTIILSLSQYGPNAQNAVFTNYL
jgi:hypothetical protein